MFQVQILLLNWKSESKLGSDHRLWREGGRGFCGCIFFIFMNSLKSDKGVELCMLIFCFYKASLVGIRSPVLHPWPPRRPGQGGLI
jgi:hypothetical protein